MDTTGSSETSAYFNQTARHHIKRNNLYCNRHEILKFHISSLRQYDDDVDVDDDVGSIKIRIIAVMRRRRINNYCNSRAESVTCYSLQPL